MRDKAEAAVLNHFVKEREPPVAESRQLSALFSAGQYVELESRARLLVERYPDSGFVWKALGLSLQRQGKDALPALREATKVLPNDAEAHCNLGNALRGVKQLDGALASCRRAIEIKPDFAMAHNNLGNVLHDLGRFSDAVASYRRAVEIKHDFAEAYCNLADAMRCLGQLEEAVASCRRALAIKPDFALAHNGLGIALYELGRLDEAQDSFRQALQINPNLAFVHNNRGLILHEFKQLDEAEASYRRAISLNPDYADAYSNLGMVFRDQGKLDEALACFQQHARLAPENGATQHQIAALSGKNTERAPEQYVESLFDTYADRFDTHLQKILKYEVPEKLVALITQHSGPHAEKWIVLDLGCGTGLVGSVIAPFARQLVGVDLSAKMLEKARVRNLYQRLEHIDLLTMMRAEKASSYDVIIAADVFIYLGKLDEIVSEIKRLLCPGGVFAFSIEAIASLSNEEARQGTQRDYQLGNSGRYSHSPNYITRLASANGLHTQEMAESQLRVEHDKPINGYMVLWKN